LNGRGIGIYGPFFSFRLIRTRADRYMSMSETQRKRSDDHSAPPIAGFAVLRFFHPLFQRRPALRRSNFAIASPSLRTEGRMSSQPQRIGNLEIADLRPFRGNLAGPSLCAGSLSGSSCMRKSSEQRLVNGCILNRTGGSKLGFAQRFCHPIPFRIRVVASQLRISARDRDERVVA